MFVGTVRCEIDIGKAHDAFRDFRFLLVEPEHKVDWDGPVIAVDTVRARVGDMVMVALSPFGDALGIPDGLPVEAAIVAVVKSLQAQRAEAPAPAPRAEERAPREDRGPREERPRRDDRPMREERAPREERPRREERGDERPAREERPRRDEPAVPEHVRAIIDIAPGSAEARPRRDERPAREERGPREERPRRDDRPMREERAPRGDRPAREERPRFEDRGEDRPAREERAPREERPRRDDRPMREERAPREERPAPRVVDDGGFGGLVWDAAPPKIEGIDIAGQTSLNARTGDTRRAVRRRK